MITVRMYFPIARANSSDHENEAFQRKFVELVASRANRRQLGDKFVRIVPAMRTKFAAEPPGIDFEFTGNNEHGASKLLEAFRQDLASELRASLGYPELRVSKADWDE